MEKAFNPNDYLMNLKGKSYLQVAHRLLWLNEDVKAGLIGGFDISTELHSEKEWEDGKTKRLVREAVYEAHITIYDKEGKRVKRSSGWGSETNVDFADYREKAETKALGRAVALVGYGTQHAPEFDEGERASPFLDDAGNRGPVGPAVADAPIALASPEKGSRRGKPAPPVRQTLPQARQVVEAAQETAEPKAAVVATEASKEDILAWLKTKHQLPEVNGLLSKAASTHGTVVIRDLPVEALRELYQEATTLLASVSND
jgi:hypothetical protein